MQNYIDGRRREEKAARRVEEGDDCAQVAGQARPART